MDRFWSKVKKSEGCWEWQATLSNKGYGQFRVDGKLALSHRFAYELAKGPILKGLHILHSCDNPACVNPDHLSVGTRADNMQDMTSKGRHHQTQKTHCPQGHEYTEANTYRHGTQRHCKACNRRKVSAYKARKKAEKEAQNDAAR